MDVNTFVVAVFCLVDDWLEEQRPQLRRRGPKPKLSDSEVLTIEIVGEFLGIDTDSGLHNHFRRYYAEWFPALRKVHRTTFARQAANLWVVKERLWRHLFGRVSFDPEVSLIDSFPVPICRLARAYRCRRLAEESAFGYDEMNKQTFYGLRAHLRVCWPGVIRGLSLAPANIHDLHVAEELLEGTEGWVLGDRNYHSPKLTERLLGEGVRLLAPYKSKKKEKRPWPPSLVQKRRRVETVIGQLVARFNARRVWARDRWHLCSRWLRKVLSHTLAIHFCQREDLSPLRFSALITD
jgi:hypothetical protein